jgi:RNA polymerase sigma-70 factor (ECF subfamily)
MADQWEKRSRIKRGGNQVLLSADLGEAERRYVQDPVDEMTPDTLYDRQWALTLIDRVLMFLKEEYELRGSQALFNALQGRLVGDKDESYTEIAKQLGMEEAAVRMALHRMRKRYGELFRREIAHTVESEAGIKDEMERLIRALS